MSTAPAKPLLTYLLALLAGAAGAVLGWLLTGSIAFYLAGFAGVSDMEGGRALLAFLGIAPFGALAGLIAGMLLVLRYHGGYRGAVNLLGRAALVGIALFAATALGLWAYSFVGDDILAKNGPPPQLAFEIKLPPGAMPPDGVEVDLNTDKNTMPATFAVTEDGGRPLIAGQVDLYFRTSSRILVLRIPGEPDRLFVLKLAANPPAVPEFGPWLHVDHIADGPDGALRKAADEDAYDVRYRVERAN